MKTHLIAALAAVLATAAPSLVSAQEAVVSPVVGTADTPDVPLDPVAAWEADRTVILAAPDVDLDDFKWRARPIIIFADSPLDPAFQTQMEYFGEEMDEVTDRDIVLITDTDPDALSDLRRALRPRGFMMVLIGKDGGVKLRKPFPWDMREIGRTIDKMPIRQREIQERRGAG